MIVHESPSEQTEDTQAKREAAIAHLSEQALWATANKAFEAGQVTDPAAFARAIKLAHSLDKPDLFSGRGEELDGGTRRGGVAGIAAMILYFREGLENAHLAWARSVIDRATSGQSADETMVPEGSVPWHEALYASRGLVADMAAGTADKSARTLLLRLAGHPLSGISQQAVRGAFSLWESDPRLGWAALHMALALCHLPGRLGEAKSNRQDRFNQALAAAEEIYAGTDWPILPPPPPAWIELPPTHPRIKRVHRTERDLEDMVDPDRYWVDPDEGWSAEHAQALLGAVAVEQVLASPARSAFLDSMAGFLDWTGERNAPSWRKPSRRDKCDSQLFEWTHGLGTQLGRILAAIPFADGRTRFFDPIIALEGEACWSLLAPLADNFLCRAVYDPPQIHPDAPVLLMACIERLLAARTFERDSYRAGQLSGFDQPRLVDTLLLISVEYADGATRFANSDWSDLVSFFPVIDRLVTEAGWAPAIMGRYLTLCERARARYPVADFARQALDVLGPGEGSPEGWEDTFLAARIAGLVQHFADRDSPLAPATAQALLRLLDRLVDMGDRRGAALQLSEAFREVRADTQDPS